MVLLKKQTAPHLVKKQSRILCNKPFHYCFQNSPSLVRCLNQMNPFRAIPCHF